ncbi:MAG: YciI family protein [Micropruina sp.]|uniref:YciI family protein n=1 Tax=Micropruina sp. TaxID=2737536 RepID=UPI0039E3EC50
MEFLVFHRDRSHATKLRRQLVERHWDYMDGFAGELIARGPTLSRSDSSPTGSVHIVDLPNPAAAWAFAFNEPNYRAGVCRDVMVRRWRNLLDRTMWQFPSGREGAHRYFVLGLGTTSARLSAPPDTSDLIAFGPLLTDDGLTELGAAALVRASSPATASEIFGNEFVDVEVHGWEFGGR